MDRVAAQMSDIGVKDQSLIWNTDLVEALELENLMGQALVTIRSADQRQDRAARTRMRTGRSAMTRPG